MAVDTRRFAQALSILFAITVLVVGIVRYPPSPKQTTRTRSAPCRIADAATNARQADLVLTGRVDMVLPAGPLGAEAIVQPLMVYRGQVTTPTIIIDAAPTDISGAVMSNDLQLASDQPPYLFFLRAIDGHYHTSVCSGSRVLGNGLTEEEQRALGVEEGRR